AGAGDDVLSLRVDEVLAVDALLAGRRVARETDAGRGVVALVPEDHLDDVDRRAEVVGDRVRAPVDLRARRVPRVEDGGDRAAELLARVLREVLARLLDVYLARLLDAVVDVEALVRDAVDGLAEHLDEAPVAVARELGVAGGARETLDRDVVEPDVEDRVHHPRHRDRSARADGDEQRVARIAEALAALLLEPLDVLGDLLVEAVDLAAGGHVGAAGVRRDREAGRDGDAELGHLGKPDPLAAEQLAAAVGGLVEGVDVAGHLPGCCHKDGAALLVVDTVRRLGNSPGHCGCRCGMQPQPEGVQVRKLLCLAVVGLAVFAVASAGASAPTAGTLRSGHAKLLGFVPAHNGNTVYRASGYGTLRYHGGPVEHTNKVYAIYWVPSGYTMESGYSSVINQFFTDVAADSGKSTNVYYTGTQYSDGSGHVQYSSSFAGSYTDTDALPASGCSDSDTSVCLSDAQLQSEIRTVVSREGWTPSPTTEFFLFTAKGIGSCSGSSCAFTQYCAYHSWSGSGSSVLLYANMPYADTVPSACDAGEHPNGNDADATINVTSHEHNE